jgi:serine protease Do
MIRLGSDTLQTDCPISPGDSGGPLFDMHGHVIGIHSAISSSLAQNYHVPISEFYENWAVLVKAESASGRPMQSRWHSYLGAHGVDDAEGCRIRALDQDSPAFRAGLEVGDVVLGIEGREVKTAAALGRWVAEAQPGETLHLEIRRGDQALSVAVKLDSEPQHD